MKPKTLLPAPTQSDPAEIAAYIKAHYGKQGMSYVTLMVKQNTKSGCTVAVDWWNRVGESLAHLPDTPPAPENPSDNPMMEAV